jgi:hypothetical protein
MIRWRWILVILAFISLMLITRINIGDGIKRIDIGPFHIVHRDSIASFYSIDIAETQPTNIELLLDIIFRNKDFLIKLSTIITPAIILFAIFLYRRQDFETSINSTPYNIIRRKIMYPLFFCAIMIIVTVGVSVFWADKKTEGSAALLQPPGPECETKRDYAKTAVVFIHGWNGNDTSWHTFPKLLCRDEYFFDAEIFVVSYPTYMARRQLTISKLARWLRQTFFSHTLRNFQDIYIIAHRWAVWWRGAFI